MSTMVNIVVTIMNDKEKSNKLGTSIQTWDFSDV